MTSYRGMKDGLEKIARPNQMCLAVSYRCLIDGKDEWKRPETESDRERRV